MSLREKFLLMLIVCIIAVTGFMILNRGYDGPEYIEPPVQKDLGETQKIVYEGKDGPVTIVFLAEYSVTAVVQSRRNYKSDAASAVSPMDLVLAWGDLNKQDIDDDIKYSQYNRWYYYRVDNDAAISLYDVQTQSANTHIIPADDSILKQLKKVRENDLVELRGYLVTVIFDPSLTSWTSSLTRLDSGDHSCEIMYVTYVDEK